MKYLPRWWGRSGRAVAAVEFAVTLPILLFFLGAVVDFGIAFYVQSCVSSVVAAGAAYATVTDANTGSVTWSNIQTAMQGAAKQILPNYTFSFIPPGGSTPDPTQCYCLGGTSPNSTVTSASCGSTCAAGGTAGKMVQLYASTTYTSILPTYSMLTGTTTLSSSLWVPLQ